MEEEDVHTFRFIVVERYMALHAGPVFSGTARHHLSGDVFELSEGRIERDDLVLRTAGAGLPAVLSQDGLPVALHRVDADTGTEYMLRAGSLYLDDHFVFSERSPFTLRFRLDAFEEYEQMDDPGIPRMITANGVDVFRQNVGLRIRIVGCTQGEADWYENEFILGSAHYASGRPVSIQHIHDRFLLLVESKYISPFLIYPSSIPSSCRLHGTESRCSACIDHYSIVKSETLPTHPVFALLLPTSASVFVLSDGTYYYKVDFVSINYGTFRRVENATDATRFELLCC
ncbi:hypothetical protein RI367_008228 [Sorochytrium milnesiophthora]